MNKSELVDCVAAKLSGSMTKKDITQVVDAIFSTDDGAIAQTVKAGGEVNLTGFGKFERRSVGARIARNPATGAKIDVAAKHTPAFKAGLLFKKAVLG